MIIWPLIGFFLGFEYNLSSNLIAVKSCSQSKLDLHCVQKSAYSVDGDPSFEAFIQLPTRHLDGFEVLIFNSLKNIYQWLYTLYNIPNTKNNIVCIHLLLYLLVFIVYCRFHMIYFTSLLPGNRCWKHHHISGQTISTCICIYVYLNNENRVLEF